MAPNLLSEDVFHDYFYSINPIAERIGKDVDATKEAYQTLWQELTVDEQNKILEESIISPEIVLKYAKYKKSDEKVPESGFSWFTRSQLDLCKHVDSVRENFYANECKTTIIKRSGVKEQQDNKLINKIKSNALFKSLMPAEDKCKVTKSDKTKPKGPPPPPPPSQAVIIPKQISRDCSTNAYNKLNEDEDDDADIPKTGFDFLDNW